VPNTISIITPWHGETGPPLLPEYFQVIQGAHVVTVDNACPHVTAGALVEMTAHMGGEYIRNETNAGFAAANNQGYAAAKGDIVIFLNSDVAPTGPWLAQVAADVRNGALYGPSLQAQLVAGRHIPYIEGWCIAATRATWERLFIYGVKEELAVPALLFATGEKWGPWNDRHYPGPYWEDNDLCLRALALGIPLIQTQWQITHKGGQTAGPIMRHAWSFADNEHTFTQRALAILKQPDMTETWQRYMQAYHTQSDIQHHVGLLYSLARGNVVELGTRTGVSTSALLAGVEARGGHVWSVDLNWQSAEVAKEHPLWTFLYADSRSVEELAPMIQTPIDLLLCDTEHTVEQVAAELELWAPHMRPGAHICIHDPETFPGVRRAVKEFCAARNWPVTFVLPCNGMAVIEVPE
jgi:predicted O-methyltransferase YrrM